MKAMAAPGKARDLGQTFGRFNEALRSGALHDGIYRKLIMTLGLITVPQTEPDTGSPLAQMPTASKGIRTHAGITDFPSSPAGMIRASAAVNDKSFLVLFFAHGHIIRKPTLVYMSSVFIFLRHSMKAPISANGPQKTADDFNDDSL